MVSIRLRPGRNHSRHKPGHNHSQFQILCRGVIWLVIGIQSILLLSKLSVRIRATTTPFAVSSTNASAATTNVWYHERAGTGQQQQNQQPAHVRKHTHPKEVVGLAQQQQQNQPPPRVPHDFENKHEPNSDEEQDTAKQQQQQQGGEKNKDHPPQQKQEQKQQQQQQQPDVLTKHGTGPAKLGYVVDLVQERNAASFRQSTTRSRWTDQDYYQPRAVTVATLAGQHETLQACEYSTDHNNNNDNNIPSFRQQAQCRNYHAPDVSLIAYNPAPFSRYVCGHEIRPGTTFAVPANDDHCDPSVVHLFPVQQSAMVPLHGQNMPDIIVVQQKLEKNGGPAQKLQRIADCDIPCLYDATLLQAAASTTNQVAVATIAGTNWTLTQTKADPAYQDLAHMDRTDYRRDQYYSTTSYQSSIPLSYYDAHKYRDALLHKPVLLSWEKLGNAATYLVDTDCTAGRRNKWYAAVQAVTLDVHAYGACEHNTNLPAGLDLHQPADRIRLLQKNRIALILDASMEKDHLTTAVWEALVSGVVPAINGASNVDLRLPPHSVISANNFNNWDKFAEYVHQVANDQLLWNSYQQWRTDATALQQWEQTTLAFTDTTPECRVCRWAYAKRYGLGWNHTQQVVQKTVLPRTLCHGTTTPPNDLVAVTRPFREVWTGMTTSSPNGAGSKSSVSQENCSSDSVSGELTLHDFVVERTVVQHDGVIDLMVQAVKRSGSDDTSALVLRLELDGVYNTDGAHFCDTHTTVPSLLRSFAVSSATIQDERSKVTVLANWVTRVHSPEAGVIEVEVLAADQDNVPDDEFKRIRVILEDMNPLHDKMTEFFPSSFGKLMMQDFVDPLELYYYEE